MGKRNWTDHDFINAVKTSKSYAEVMRKLDLKPAGGNYDTVKREIKRLKLDTSHMTGKVWNVGERYKPIRNPIPLNEILVKDSSYKSTYSLKNRLFKEGLKEKKCECCGNTTWMGKEIPLELHHKNGDHTDLRIENLQILCPNCHALTDNYRGKKSAKKETLKVESHKIGENSKKKNSELSTKNKNVGESVETRHEIPKSKIKNNKNSKKPTKEELLLKFKELKYFVQVGKYYGVSDNAVRKWCKSYNILDKVKE